MGRDAEIRNLADALEELFSGQGSIHSLVGQPGIGKTRLAREFASRARERGARVAWGRCSTFEVPPYWPWIQIVREFSEFQDDSIALEAAEIGHRLEDGLHTEFERFKLFDRLANFLRKVARSRPLVLIIDDLQFADEFSLLFLRFVEHDLWRSSILVLIIYRPAKVYLSQPTGQLLREVTLSVTKRISLYGLSHSEVAQLIDESTERESDVEIVEAIYYQTGGNPLFIETLLRYGLVDWGKRSVSWVPEVLLPVIERYLSSVSAVARELLTLASLAGMEFEFSMIRRASRLDAEKALDALAEGTLAGVVKRIDAPGWRYRFVHQLIRDALQGMLEGARSARLHTDIAEALEALYLRGADISLYDIAYHFVEGATLGDAAKGLKYSQHAAEHADAQQAFQEASRWYRMALSVLDFRPNCDENGRCDLELALAASQSKVSDVSGARLSYRRAEALANRLADPERTARAMIGQAELPAEASETLRLIEKPCPSDGKDDAVKPGGVSDPPLLLESRVEGHQEVRELQFNGQHDNIAHRSDTDPLGELSPAKMVAAHSRHHAAEAESRLTLLSADRIFRKEGEFWTIVYDNTVIRLRHSKGLAYIAFLMAHPGREFHVTDLAPFAERRITAGKHATGNSTEEVEPKSSNSGPALDLTAKSAYRKRLHELRDELEETKSFNDLGRTSKIEREMEFLSRELSRAVGLGGRDRRPGSETERSRLRVTNAIRFALKKVMKQYPALGRYLANSIQTGNFCLFKPDSRFPGFWQT